VPSSTEAHNPFSTTIIRGRVAEKITGDEAWDIIDRIAHKYAGQSYPARTGRIVFLIDP
jgi:hypothetical protein